MENSSSSNRTKSEGISDDLELLAQCDPKITMTIAEIFDKFSKDSFLLLLILFALPVAIPVPHPPGFSTLMSIPLIILSIQMLLGHQKAWLPAKIYNYSIKGTTLISFITKITPTLRFLEKYLKPRFEFVQSIYMVQLLGVVNLLSSVCVSIPVPFTNTIPAWSIVITSLAMLRRDGLIILIGVFIGMIGMFISFSAVIKLWVLIEHLIEKSVASFL